MKLLFPRSDYQPVPIKIILLIFVSLSIVLSVVAGYYKAAYEAEQRKYLRLEDMFVRVRNNLGRERTQEIIDQSYQLEKNTNK